ncbi:uncharacterized protein LOC119732872 [Patiria miniata]|uniref:UPA domain-containing protein n=1 Tax=Patiria miniata TaxID=46514 RepID=A0A914AFA2_PATMI|nr:uncharacterized protein LOC119732872 [Patiria miniata]XP_038062399.1 uncharacterized protein LOC119732872 [Patiria miniata]
MAMKPVAADVNIIKVGAFGDVFRPWSPEYSFRVHLWKNQRKTEEEVFAVEANLMKSNILDVPRFIPVDFADERAVMIEITDIDEQWDIKPELKIQSIPISHVMHSPENSVTFNLSTYGPEDSFFSPDIDVAIYQNPEKKVRLSFKPQEH